jgi:predicted transposase YdaD
VKEKKMPYVTSIERIGVEKGMEKGRAIGRLEGLQDGLAAALVSKFGAPCKKLLPRIRRIEDPNELLALQRALNTATKLDEFRRALP